MINLKMQTFLNAFILIFGIVQLILLDIRYVLK